MLRASVRLHNPAALYDHLEEEVGPLSMHIKNGYPLIRFHSHQHHNLAAKRFAAFNFHGQNIELLPYSEETQQTAPPVQDETAIAAIGPPEGISKEWLGIIEGLEVQDSLDCIERLVKRHKKSMIEHIAASNAFMREAQHRLKKYSETSEGNDDRARRL